MAVLTAIAVERDRQEELCRQAKFPWTCAARDIENSKKYVVLGEEVGEVARAMLEAPSEEMMRAKLYEELIQVAAVAAAWCEALCQEKKERL